MKRVALHPCTVMSLTAVVLFGTLTLICEKMPFAGGLGFDGISYAMLVREIHRLLDGSLQLGLATSNRFFPSLLCRLALSGLGLALTDHNIVRFFEIYNLLLLTGGAWLWCSLAMHEGFSARGRWLGFVALFFSHATLKYNIYYAVLTDLTAMTLGLAMLWAYRRGQMATLLAVAAVGGVTWPTLLPQGILLWLFPRRTTFDDRPAPKCSIVLATALVALLILHFFQRHEVPLPESIWPLLGATIEVGYLGFGMYHFFNSMAFFTPIRLLASIHGLRLGLAIVVIYLFPLALSNLTHFKLNILALGDYYIYSSVRAGLKFPGEFLIAHPLYFGPWVLLLGLLFRGAADQARRAGLGLLLVCLLVLVQALTPLSRQLIAGMPFFVYLLVGAAERDSRLNSRFLPWFTMLSLLYSKLWMRFSTNAVDPEKTFSFDWYVSSTGFWMPFSFYFWQGLIVLATAVGLWLALRRRPDRSDAMRQSSGSASQHHFKPRNA